MTLNYEAIYYTNSHMKDWVNSHQVFFFSYLEQNYWSSWQHLTVSKPSFYQLVFFVVTIGSWFFNFSKESCWQGCQEAHLFARGPQDPVNCRNACSSRRNQGQGHAAEIAWVRTFPLNFADYHASPGHHPRQRMLLLALADTSWNEF